MRVLFLVPLLGLTLGPRTVVSNTITSYTVTEVEEDTGATDAGDGDIGVYRLWCLHLLALVKPAFPGVVSKGAEYQGAKVYRRRVWVTAS